MTETNDLRPIPGFPGYSINLEGEVYADERIKPGKSGSFRHMSRKKLKADRRTDGRGYARYTLFRDGKRFRRSVRSLLKSLK
jgi:hypothetical protein